MIQHTQKKQKHSNNQLNDWETFAESVSATDTTAKAKAKAKKNLSNKSNTNKLDKLTEQINDSIENLSLLNSVKKGIIYARCSSIKQTLDSNTSLETQVALCLEYCSNNTIFIIDIYKEIVPGHDINKLNLYDIVNNFSNINIILADPSRMSRNVSDADTFLKKCDEKNITVHFARDNLMSNILNDRRNIIGLIHDAYTETKIMSKRIKSSINVRKRKGSFIGNPSFGYKIQKVANDNNSIVIRKPIPDDDEQLITQIIKELYYGISHPTTTEQLIKHLGSNKKFKLKWLDNTPMNVIYYGNITSPMIANILNENSIMKRGKDWTPESVLTVINNLNIDDKEIYYNPNYKINNTHQTNIALGCIN